MPSYCSSGNWLGHAKHISPTNGRLSIMYASGRAAANLLPLFLLLHGDTYCTARPAPWSTLIPTLISCQNRCSLSASELSSFPPIASSRRTPGLEIDQSRSRPTTAACHIEVLFLEKYGRCREIACAIMNRPVVFWISYNRNQFCNELSLFVEIFNM